MLDTTRLRHDITCLINDCRTLKRLLRAPWTRPMAEEQRRHARLRRDLTDLFVVLAASRGRLHLLRPPHGVDATTWDATDYHRRVSARLTGDTSRPITLEARP